MYSFLLTIISGLRWLINGKTKVTGRNNLPKGNYVLIAPHRTFWDPVWHALAAKPKKFIFMAKKELNVPIFGWILKKIGAFYVDRENPGPSAIKIPVTELRDGQRSLVIYPTGSRHSQQLQSGAITIAKLAKVPMVPVVYQGPVKFLQLFKRNNTTVAIGKVIDVPEGKLNEVEQDKLFKQIQTAFDNLDDSINPDYVYVDPSPKKINKK